MAGYSIAFDQPHNATPALATSGVLWTKPADFNLATHFPNAPGVHLARSPGCRSTTVYLDKGLVLELVSNSTANIETFGLWLALPAGQHDKKIDIQLEFDVIEVLQQVDKYRYIRVPYWRPGGGFGWKEVRIQLPWRQIRTNPVVSAVGVVASDGTMSTGVEAYDNNRCSATCQVKYETGPIVAETYFRLNAPFTSGRGSFDWIRFEFFRSKFWKPIPAVTPRPAWSDNSSFPLQLRMTIDAANSPNKLAQVTVSLTQTDSSSTKSFASRLGTNTFDSVGVHSDGSDTFTNSLAALSYAGFVLAIAKPATSDPPPNCGPVRARVRRLTVDCT